MKYLPLVWAGIWRRRGRTILILLSIINAFLLFGLLQGFAGGLDHAAGATNADVLVTASRVSRLEPQPLSQLGEIKSVPGVRTAMPIVSLQGTYRTPSEKVNVLTVDPNVVAATDPDMKVPSAQLEALKHARIGALVDAKTAQALGLKVGDRLSIASTFWSYRDGSRNWPLEIVGIYPPNPSDLFFGKGMLVNFDYVDESRLAFSGTANVFLVRVADAARAAQVAADIDSRFANSPHATKTVSQRQLAQDQVRQIGEIGVVVDAVVGAMFFALLFSIGAVLLQGLGERMPEFAVLKTLGFSDGAVMGLILAEGLLLCLIGASIGLILSVVLAPVVRNLTGFDPQIGSVIGLGFVMAAGLAFISGMPPALRGMRLRIVDALAGR